MKIGLAHNLYKPYAKGGAEKVVEKMTTDFLNNGHEVFIISTEPKKRSSQKDTNIENNNGIKKEKIYFIPSSYYDLGDIAKALRLFWHLGNFCNPKRKTKIEKILDIEKPNLFITHNLVGVGFFLVNILKKRKIRHEHFLHDIQLLHPSGLMFSGEEWLIESKAAKIYQGLTKSIFKDVAKVISPSKWLLNEHIKKGFFSKSETEIRPLHVLSEIKTRNEQEQDSKNGKFLFVGQIEKHKGVLFLIDTFKKIENSKISLTLIGNGKDFEEAKKLAASDKRINFLGRVESSVIKTEMEKAGALIVPSLCYENSPNVIYEAREAGLPVIASRLGGIPEIIADSEMLFKAGDAESLSQKIKACS